MNTKKQFDRNFRQTPQIPLTTVHNGRYPIISSDLFLATVALSAQQAELFEQAVAQHRKLELLLAKMRDISQTFLLQSVPGPVRRKRAKPS
jgi:hypothetical protein